MYSWLYGQLSLDCVEAEENLKLWLFSGKFCSHEERLCCMISKQIHRHIRDTILMQTFHRFPPENAGMFSKVSFRTVKHCDCKTVAHWSHQPYRYQCGYWPFKQIGYWPEVYDHILCQCNWMLLLVTFIHSVSHFSTSAIHNLMLLYIKSVSVERKWNRCTNLKLQWH